LYPISWNLRGELLPAVSVTAHRRFELINLSKGRHVSPRGGFCFARNHKA
jgi:hypothetical protein